MIGFRSAVGFAVVVGFTGCGNTRRERSYLLSAGHVLVRVVVRCNEEVTVWLMPASGPHANPVGGSRLSNPGRPQALRG